MKTVELTFTRGKSLVDALDTTMLELAIRKGTWDIYQRAVMLVVERAFDTGRLAHSIDFEQEDALEYVIYADVEYAGYVHDGTERMEARPFFVWAVDMEASRIERAIEQAIERGTR